MTAATPSEELTASVAEVARAMARLARSQARVTTDEALTTAIAQLDEHAKYGHRARLNSAGFVELDTTTFDAAYSRATDRMAEAQNRLSSLGEVAPRTGGQLGQVADRRQRGDRHEQVTDDRQQSSRVSVGSFGALGRRTGVHLDEVVRKLIELVRVGIDRLDQIQADRAGALDESHDLAPSRSGEGSVGRSPASSSPFSVGEHTQHGRKS